MPVRPRLAVRSAILAIAALGILGAPAAQGRVPTLQMQYHLDTGHTQGDQFTTTPDSSPYNGSALVRYATDVPGKFGRAFSIGGYSWVYGGSPGDAPAHLTVIEWVKAAESPGPSKYLISKDHGNCTPPAYGMYTSFAGAVDAGGLEFFVTNAGQTYSPPGVTAAQVWDGQWHMVAGTFNGTTARFYLDGVQVGNGVAVPGPITYTDHGGGDTGRVNVGGYGTFGDTSCGQLMEFQGHVDEARLYDEALTQTELQRLASAPGPDPPLFQLDPVVLHTTSIDQIASSSARVNGTIDDAGNPTPYGVLYGLVGDSKSKVTAAQQSAGIRERTQDVHVPLTGLEPDTEYRARIEAGALNGGTLTFHTPGVAVVKQDSGAASVGERGGKATLTVKRVGGIATTSTVTYATANGTATAGSDYTSTSGTLTFNPGQSEKTIEVPIVNNTQFEGAETFTVSLSGPTGANLGSPSTTTVTIDDDDLPVRFTSATASIGEASDQVVLSVERPGEVSTAATVDFHTTDGTATAGSDYAATSGTLSFPAGQHTATIQVPISEDTADEPGETFTVTLTNPVGTTTGNPKTATVTIIDNDLPPDTTAPGATIALDPVDPPAGGAYLGPVTVTVGASDDREGPLQTRCVLDPPSVPADYAALPSDCPYTSGAAVEGLGAHRVYAASRDSAGNAGPVVSRSFRVSRVPETTIDRGPSSETWRPNNLFYFSSPVPGSTFECRLDGGDFAPCTEPFETGVLAQTAHTFFVRAIAPGGAVDPTPAEQSFSVAQPRSARHACVAKPAFYWLITWFGHEDRVGCQIGTPDRRQCTRDIQDGCGSRHFGADGCPLNMNCVFTRQVCPVGARCTIATKTSWYDADENLNWGAEALSIPRSIVPVDTNLLSRPGPYDCTLFAITKTCIRLPSDNQFCETGFERDRCSTSARVDFLGDGRPLLSFCSLYVPFRPARAGARLGPDYVRRIECDAEWHVYPAPELAAVPNGTRVQVGTMAGGVVSMLPTILGLQKATLSTAAAKPPVAPRIGRSRAVVKRAGPVTLQLKLNKAAKRLLAKKRKLRVRLRLTFTTPGRRAVTRTRTVVLTALARAPRVCRAHKPKHHTKRPPKKPRACAATRSGRP